MQETKPVEIPLSFEQFRQEVLDDYKLAWTSRHSSVLMRKEVLRGKAKFGITGAGKELPQIALSKFFKNGDFRAGYYRDQTLSLALKTSTVRELFSILYSDADINHDPNSAGRQMSSHFASRLLDEQGQWKNLMNQPNHSADAAPTASQMGRAVGLGLASKLYRKLAPSIPGSNRFTDHGNEVVFATIGDASTSEGIFLEAVNAIAVQQLPVVISVWDDGYGISVPRSLQTAKDNISKALRGYKRDKDGPGFAFYEVKAWDYPNLVQTYKEATELAREKHIPVFVHVLDVTQPLGHSTSGSHERYKDDERLEWESEFDCISKFKSWIVENHIADLEQLQQIEQETLDYVKSEINESWDQSFDLAKQANNFVNQQLEPLKSNPEINSKIASLVNQRHPKRSETDEFLRQLRLEYRRDEDIVAVINQCIKKLDRENEELYRSKLFTESVDSPQQIELISPAYDEDSNKVNGFELLNACFDANLAKYPELVAFGEDLGKIGGVNQSFAGLQNKYGEDRVFDTGIREGTIMGQAIGLAMRGFRPIGEIQYLDYLLYGLQQLSDEVATLSFRTKAGQKVPLIVRTRGHRLEGIWHTGSPMGMIINALRGMHVLTPRNMTQAAGMYNTLLAGDEPGILIEPLNAYRLKEIMPSNIADFRIPFGQPEIIRSGTDLTLVTYGSCVQIAQDATKQLEELGISVELIDAQTLLPFDQKEMISQSVQKTNRLVVLDEDVPGGASAFILNQVLEKQNAYQYLDSAPITITSTEHRTGYGNEYNYFSKPQPIHVIEAVYKMMHETNPSAFPKLS